MVFVYNVSPVRLLKSTLFNNNGTYTDDYKEEVDSQRDTLPQISTTNPADTKSLLIQKSSQEDKITNNRELLALGENLEKLMAEALGHPKDEERELLQDILNEYKSNLDKFLGKIDKDKRDDLVYVTWLFDRHIWTWNPFYYYLHIDSKRVLRKSLNLLEEQHKESLKNLTDKDAELAGTLATEHLRFVIEDIAKSGRRRNSDFVIFSFYDYQEYRKFFDELWTKDAKFKLGFAKKFHILFNAFYNMHRDVDPEHNEEVRTWLKDMREELIRTHQSALKETQDSKHIVKNVIEVLDEEFKARQSQHQEVKRFIQQDLSSYRTLLNSL